MQNEITYFDHYAQDERVYESTLFFGELLGEDFSSIAIEGFVNIKDSVIALGKRIADFFIKLKDIIMNFFKNLAKTAEYEIKVPNEMKKVLVGIIKCYTDQTSKYINGITKIEDVFDHDAAYIDACLRIDTISEELLVGFNKRNHSSAKEDYSLSVEDCQEVALAGANAMEKLANIASTHINKLYAEMTTPPTGFAAGVACINKITSQSIHMTRACNRVIGGSAKKIKL